MGKAPNGQGSVRKVRVGKHKGKWRVAVVVGRTERGTLRRKTGIFAKQADAEAFRAEQVAKRAAGAFAPVARRTVAEQLWLWHGTIEADRADSTVAGYRHFIRNHIAPHVGGFALAKLDMPTVEGWLKKLDEAGVGARSRQMAFTVLRMALDHAVRRRDLAANPCAEIARPRYKRGKIDPFGRDEANWILADSFEGPHAALIRLLLSTGIRQGEAFGLRPQDVDLFGRTVRITRQVVETEGRVVVQEYPKTNSGNRTLALTDAAVVLLAEHRRRMMAKGYAGRDFEFVSAEGCVIRRSTWGDRVWRPMLERIGRERGAAVRHRGAHHLRHTFATLMLGDGVPLHVVSKILGHAKPSITADLYAHAIPEQVDEAGAAARRLFG